MTTSLPRIVVLGASGLIGGSVARYLIAEGLPTVAVARRLGPAQRWYFGEAAEISPIAGLSVGQLGDLLQAQKADLVVNCLGVLQDGPSGGTADIHEAFVGRLLAAVGAQPKPVLLLHVSMPGQETEDATAFSRTKRAGERLIAASGVPFVVLRPGFVVAPAAFGGSALLRALATVPLGLPEALATRPFAAVAVEDIGRTVVFVAGKWAAGERDWKATWDLCEPNPGTVGSVLAAFRMRIGGPAPRLVLPAPLLWLGARAGDAVARLGWSPPIRTTALWEMSRGVEGDPDPWIEATGIAPKSLAGTLRDLPATVQERWFSRLYLLKPIVLAGLALFWIVSGLIALTVAFEPASAILSSHGVPGGLARTITLLTSLADLTIGIAIAIRWTCRPGLLAGISLSLAYMAGAAILTPALWLDPLGPLVKTGPAILLMAVALAILEDR